MALPSSKSSSKHHNNRVDTEDSNSKKKYSPIKETEDEEAQYTSSEHYSSSRFEESSARFSNKKGTASLSIANRKGEERKSADHMRESYMSSSMSTEKPVHSVYAKKVAEFMKNSADKDDYSVSASESNDKDLGSVMD